MRGSDGERRPSTVDRRPSTVDCRPSTVDLDLDLDLDRSTVDFDCEFHPLAPSVGPAQPARSRGATHALALLPSSRAAPSFLRNLAALTQRAGISDPELRDQATRASKSALLNLSEGLPSDLPGVRRRYFRQSDGSLHEVVAAIDLARFLGAIDRAAATELQQLAKRLRDMLRGLLRADARGR